VICLFKSLNLGIGRILLFLESKYSKLARSLLIFFLFFTFTDNLIAQQLYVLSGTVTDSVTHESLPSASVEILSINKGTVSDASGRFELEIPSGIYQLRVSFLGYQTMERSFSLIKNETLKVQLAPISVEVESVTISSRKSDENVTSVQAGVLQIDSKQMSKLPTLMGEPDIINAIRLTPGVQSVGEGNTGIYVRGGDAGQNLILLENMPLYNPSHLLGFFPVFNSDILSQVRLIKGGIPANYGGKTSSVIDLAMKEGNREKFSGSGSVGLLSSDLTLESPLNKGKGSLIISGRRTYLDVIELLSQPFIPLSKNFFEQTNYYFYDGNIKFTHQLGTKTRLTISAFGSKDKYSLSDEKFSVSNKMNWANLAGNANIRHSLSDNISVGYTLGVTNYFFEIDAGFNTYKFNLYSGVRDWFQNLDFTHKLSDNSRLKYGVAYTRHVLTPNKVAIDVEKVNFSNTNQYFSNEGAIYLQGDYSFTSNFSISAGIRQTYFQHVGPYTQYSRNEVGQIDDSTVYAKNQNVKDFLTWDPNLSWVFLLNSQSSVKGTFSLTHQFIHLASVGTVSLPTDVWFPSAQFIDPQRVGLVTLGYFRNFFSNTIETSVEAYYKKLNNQIEFLNGVLDNFDNTKIEQNIITGSGKAYGIEFFVKKQLGKTTGSVSYTLSRTLRQFDEINNGEPFPAKYDRIHDLAITMNHELSNRWNLSAVFIYATGNAMTLPTGRYIIQGNVANDYTSANSFRMPPYHRLDISATCQLMKRNNWESSLIFSVYNVYNRANPYFIYFQVKGDIENYYLSVAPKQISLFPILPSVTWSFKF